VVKALDFGGITIRSKVRIPFGVNSLGHTWRKPNLTNPCGGSALHGSGVYPFGVGTQSDPTLGGFPVIIFFFLKKKRIYINSKKMNQKKIIKKDRILSP
jgi:hypothetical protein